MSIYDSANVELSVCQNNGRQAFGSVCLDTIIFAILFAATSGAEMISQLWPWTTKPIIKGKFFEIEIYTSSESWINKLSMMYGLIGKYLPEMQLFENLNIEKIAFKDVQMKFLVLIYYSRKFAKYLHGIWSLLNILMIFGIKIYNFDPYNVLLTIATNIPVLLMILWSRVTIRVTTFKLE